MKGRAAVVCLLLASAGCGSGTPAVATTGATTAAPDLPPLPRSSIAAVILHREELALADDQVRALREIDEKLAEHRAALLEGPARPRPDGGVAPSSGDRLHFTGSHGGGGRPRGTYHAAPSAAPAGRSVQERLDDEDTRAYLRAEEDVLTPAQRERARSIAEKYREDLYDRRAREAE